MKYLLIIILCISLMGCGIREENINNEKDEVHIVENRTNICIAFKKYIDTASNQYMEDINLYYFSEEDIRNLKSLSENYEKVEKLLKFSNELVECSNMIYKYKPFKEKCGKVSPKGEAVKEYNDGWFCDDCRKERVKELNKKLKSLEKKK